LTLDIFNATLWHINRRSVTSRWCLADWQRMQALYIMFSDRPKMPLHKVMIID